MLKTNRPKQAYQIALRIGSCWRLNLAGVSLAILGFCGIAHASEAPVAEIGGRLVGMGLIRSDDRSPVSWPVGDSHLATEVISTSTDTNVADRLASHGIDPDSGAYTLVYDLNPTVSNLDSLPVGTRLVVPTVVASRELGDMLKDGSHLVILSVDPQLRRELASAATSLGRLRDQFVGLPSERFASSVDRARLQNEIADLADWFEYIRLSGQQRKGPPTSRDTLVALTKEAQVMVSLLDGTIGGQGLIATQDEAQISAIHADLQREMKRYDDVMSGGIPDSGEARCCTLEVSILGADPKNLERFRVYYTLNGLFHRPPPEPLGSTPFPSVGGGESGPLRPKNYRVWVAPDGKPDQLLTEDALFVSLDQGEQRKKIQLLLKEHGKDKQTEPTK